MAGLKKRPPNADLIEEMNGSCKAPEDQSGLRKRGKMILNKQGALLNDNYPIYPSQNPNDSSAHKHRNHMVGSGSRNEWTINRELDVGSNRHPKAQLQSHEDGGALMQQIGDDSPLLAVSSGPRAGVQDAANDDAGPHLRFITD